MTYQEVAHNIRASFAGLDTKIPASSRIDQMLEAMSSGTIDNNDPKFGAAKEAIRDLLILQFILEHKPPDVTDNEFSKRLRLLIKDPVDPIANPGKVTDGRNFQHELYVAAVCAAAGLYPRFSEPDVVATHIGQNTGFAAKRMRNWNRFEDHCRKASDQIRQSGLPGWIVCDMTHAFDNPNEIIPLEISDDLVYTEWSSLRHKFIKRHEPCFETWFKGSDVRAIILMEHFLKCEATDRASLSSYTFFVNLHRNRENKTCEFDSIRGMWTEALPN